MKQIPTLLIFAATLGATSAAVTTPYTDSFTGANGVTPSMFTVETASGGSFSIQSNAFQADLDPGGSGAAFASALIDVTDLGGPGATGSNFFYTSTLTIDNITLPSDGNKGYQTGLAALASGITGGGEINNGYVMGFQIFGTGNNAGNTGRMQIFEASGGSLTEIGTTTPNFGGDLSVGSTITLRLTGTYNLGSLDLNFTATDGTASETVVATDLTPQTGTGFGYRNRLTGNNDPRMVVSYDDFAIAVPEPTSTALTVLGALAILRRRR